MNITLKKYGTLSNPTIKHSAPLGSKDVDIEDILTLCSTFGCDFYAPHNKRFSKTGMGTITSLLTSAVLKCT